jgi:hypothetical protein
VVYVIVESGLQLRAFQQRRNVIAFSIAIAWVYARTHGSLLLTMLMHSALDQTIGIVSDVLALGEKPFVPGASLSFVLTIAFMWIVMNQGT